jgi:hypothetical protein
LSLKVLVGAYQLSAAGRRHVRLLERADAFDLRGAYTADLIG